MKTWIVIAVIAVMIAFAGIVVVNAVSDTPVEKANYEKCGLKCGNSCTAENNCGLETCKALQGKTCACGK